MKISQKQIQLMYQVLVGSLEVSGNIGLSYLQRKMLAEKIANQQDEELKDYEKPA